MTQREETDLLIDAVINLFNVVDQMRQDSGTISGTIKFELTEARERLLKLGATVNKGDEYYDA